MCQMRAKCVSNKTAAVGFDTRLTRRRVKCVSNKTVALGFDTRLTRRRVKRMSAHWGLTRL